MAKKCTRADKGICGPVRCGKYDKLTKGGKRRAPGSPKGSPKTVSYKASEKKKTLWMRWLWAYHCEAKKANPKTKYSDSMRAAADIYKSEDMKSASWTDTELRDFARKIL